MLTSADGEIDQKNVVLGVLAAERVLLRAPKVARAVVVAVVVVVRVVGCWIEIAVVAAVVVVLVVVVLVFVVAPDAVVLV